MNGTIMNPPSIKPEMGAEEHSTPFHTSETAISCCTVSGAFVVMLDKFLKLHKAQYRAQIKCPP